MVLTRLKRRVRSFCLFTISLSAFISSVHAGEPELSQSPRGLVLRQPEQVSIQTLLSPQAASYQRHLVTLEGEVRDIEVTAPFGLLRCGRLLYGQATFILDDATGSIPVDVFGSCLGPHAITALPQNGDFVRVTVVIQVLTNDPPRGVRARVIEMQILDQKRSP